MRRIPIREKRARAALALLLAWIGGYVDAVGYLLLGHLFMAHMSGNSAAMGAYLGQGDWRHAVHRALPVPLFVAGVMGGMALTELACRRGARSPFSIALGLEALLLAAFVVAGMRSVPPPGSGAYYALMSLLPLAMGLQNATLRRVGGWTVRTTYISGQLTNFAEQAVEFGCDLHRFLRKSPGSAGARLRLALRHPAFQRAALAGGICGAFVTGAILGGLLQGRWQARALVIPLCGVLGVVLQDLVRPIGAPPGCKRRPRVV